MTLPILTSSFFSNAWQVFLLFAIPIGGGIPAGVVLGHSRGLSWVSLTVLYFISDVALACVLEPIMKLMVVAGKRNKVLSQINEAFKKSMNKTISKYGISPRPLTLVLIAFGVDPMTGRAAALAAGHNFFSGWTIAILGDMVFFLVIMVSTLFLNSLLGDGTWTAVIIMIAMMVGPGLVRRIRDRFKTKTL